MSRSAVLFENQTGQARMEVDAADAFLCPLPVRARELATLSLDLCRALDADGCPLALRLQEHLRFETFLADLSAALVHVPARHVDTQIESALRQIVEFLEIDRSAFAVIPPGESRMVVAHSCPAAGALPFPPLLLDDPLPWYAQTIRQGMPLRLSRLPDDLPPEAVREREYCTQVGMKSLLSIPLETAGAVVGAVEFASFSSYHDWPDEWIPRLRLMGDLFSNALARKQADEALRAREQSLRQTREDRRKLAARLLHAQEEERRRIAREMHDDWTQRLALLTIDVSRLEGRLGAPEVALPLLRAMQEKLVGLSEDVHALSRQLHPSILDDLGLVEALRSACAGLSRREGVAVVYRPEEVPGDLPRDVALCVYRIAQEALRNCAKHAAVKEAWVALRGTGAELVLRVEDHGVGFDPAAARSAPGLGLSSMEERARLIPAELSVTSAPGQGATVELRVRLGRSDP